MSDTKEKIDRWKQFNLIVEDEKLDIKEKGLLLILFRFVNHNTGYANPSRELLKKLYGTKKNSVLDKVLGSLIEKGYIIRESGKGIRSKYFIKVGTQIVLGAEKVLGIQIDPIVGTKIDPIVGTQIVPQKEKIKEKEKNIYSPSSENILEADEELEQIAAIKNRLMNSYPKDILEIVLEDYKQDKVKRQVPQIVLLTNIEKELIRLSKEKSNENNIKPLPKQLKEKVIYKDLHFIDDVIDKVKITEEQYKTLVKKHGEDLVNNQIIALDNYIVNGKGKKYKDHYRALNTWCNSYRKNSIPSKKKNNDEALEKYLS